MTATVNFIKMSWFMLHVNFHVNITCEFEFVLYLYTLAFVFLCIDINPYMWL